MAQVANTSIKQYGPVNPKCSQVFGQGEVILRIGNGGAGAAGLVEALAKDYLSLKGNPGSIEWVFNHSRNTQLALLAGYVDVSLTYEREQEEIAVSEGWAENAGCVFHDHFCLVGPEHDPANVRQAKSIEEAFHRIAATRSLFHSRSDGSATMWRERSIWSRCHQFPWNARPEWYIQTMYGPTDAVHFAAASGAYLLTDRSSLLHQISQGAASNYNVFFEPTDDFHVLMNSCYALHTPLSNPGANEEISSFIDYLKSRRGQGLISDYGVDKVGIPFFAPVKQGFAGMRLVGGRVINGKWGLEKQRSLKL